MAVKLLGSLLIAFGIYIIGMSFCYKEKQRIESLAKLKSDINLLMSELIYNRSTLYNVLLTMNGCFKPVYEEIVKGLDNNNSAELSWCFGFSKYKDRLYINKDDIEDVKKIGSVFSSPDCDYQRTELEGYTNRLEKKINYLEQIYIKNNRLYRNISVSLAMFVVIMLF